MKTKAIKENCVSLILAFLLVFPVCATIIPQSVSAEGATCYVDGAYNNENGPSDGSLSKPFKTIQAGLDAAHNAGAGSTVYVREGTYQVSECLRVGQQKNSPYQRINNISLKAYPGEAPVIDGQNQYPPNYQDKQFSWSPLVLLYGVNATIDGFEVRNSNGRGIQVEEEASNIVIKNCNIHGGKNEGIFINGVEGFLIDNCKVWENCNYDKNIENRGGGWPPGISCKNASYGTVQNCDVYNNWGEGINCWYNTHHITIQDNIFHDNYAVEIYLDRASYITVQRNLVYGVPGSEYSKYKSGDVYVVPCNGIMIADEVNKYTPGSLVGHDRTIINNILIQNGSNIAFWYAYKPNKPDDSGLVDSGLKNDIISNNTLVDGVSSGININSSDCHENVTIKNNIIKQSQGNLVSVPQSDEFTFSNNCWSSAVTGIASGDGDKIGDPGLVGGDIGEEYFKLTNDSKCINAGVKVPGVNEDYFRNKRFLEPDIGAHEFQYDLYKGNNLSDQENGTASYRVGNKKYIINEDFACDATHLGGDDKTMYSKIDVGGLYHNDNHWAKYAGLLAYFYDEELAPDLDKIHLTQKPFPVAVVETAWVSFDILIGDVDEAGVDLGNYYFAITSDWGRDGSEKNLKYFGVTLSNYMSASDIGKFKRICFPIQDLREGPLDEHIVLQFNKKQNTELFTQTAYCGGFAIMYCADETEREIGQYNDLYIDNMKITYERPYIYDDFEDNNCNGWTIRDDYADMEVASDEGNYVFKQPTTGTTGQASMDDIILDNCVISARIKIHENTVKYGASGIIARATEANGSPQNYYWFRLEKHNHVEIWKIVNGNPTKKAYVNMPVNTDTWYDLKLVLDGNNLIGYVNGEEKISYTDNEQPLTSGYVGARSYKQSFSVDDFTITY